MLPILAALVLAATQPGPAGTDVSCILDRISPELRADVLEEAASGKGGPVRAAFADAAQACARERSWDSVEANRFEHLAAARTVVSEASARLQANGIDPRLVLDWYQSQPPARRRAPGEREVSGLFARLSEAGVSTARIQENVLPLAVMIGALAAVERLSAEIAD